MKRFSDAIKICQTSDIKGELENLGKHIKTFCKHLEKDLKSEFLAKIIDTIERDYCSLIGRSARHVRK